MLRKWGVCVAAAAWVFGGLFARLAGVLRGSAILTSSRDCALLPHVIYPRKQKPEVVMLSPEPTVP